MEDLASYIPKSKEVPVGALTLTVKEFSVAKRDAIVKVLLHNLDAAKLIGPFMEAFRSGKRVQAEMVAEMTQVTAEMKKVKASEDEIRDRLAGIAAGYRTRANDEDELDFASVAGQIKDLVQKLLSNDLTLVSCIALDVLDNRQRAKIDGPEKVTMEKRHGYEYSEKMFRWVKDNLTMPQERLVLAAIVEVNDVAGLVKNYWTPVSTLLTKVSEEPGETTEAE